MGSGGVPWARGQIFLSVTNWFQAHGARGIRGSYLPDEKARLSETMGLPWAHSGLQVYSATSSPSNQSRHIWQTCGFQALLYWVSLGTPMGMGGGSGYTWEVGLLIRRALVSFFSSVQSLSCVCLFVTPWTAACQASLCITNSQSLLKLMSFESVMPSNYLILYQPLLPPSMFPGIRVFPNELVWGCRIV